MYVDYSYYVGVYGGTMPEEKFMKSERQAEAQIRYITCLNGDIFSEDSDAVRDAVCAVSDVIFEDIAMRERRAQNGINGSVKSENNDGYSVTYVTEQVDGQTSEEVLRRKIYHTVCPYLLPTGWLSRRVRCV